MNTLNRQLEKWLETENTELRKKVLNYLEIIDIQTKLIDSLTKKLERLEDAKDPVIPNEVIIDANQISS